MRKDFDITKTKLIIWDLDETFWDGTLAEDKNIKFKPENLKLVEDLTEKGIMNSICSKNDFLNVKNQFLLNGYTKYWDLFVFPSINWTSKGLRVKNIVDSMNLRYENVIFIDDNRANINEVKFYCPNIMTAPESQIYKIAQELYLVNEYDFKFTRLKQYKILEEKQNDKISTNCSSEEFLRKSEIKICIKKDCSKNIDRIDKLIHRTNQLNFTKKRVEKSDLKQYFNNQNYGCAYIIAQDKYGDYGICGFYVLDKNKNKLEHFLFSCRIMNMGIEQFLYSYLKTPEIEIVKPVSSSLEKNVDWIEIVEEIEIREEEKKTNGINILFKGACDLYSTISYISGNCNIDTELPYWNKRLKYIVSHTHTAFIEQTHRLKKEKLEELSKKFPFPDMDEFKTNFFDKKYDAIVLSLLTATFRGIYINKNDGTYVEYGFANCDITDENNWDKVLASIPEIHKENNRILLRNFKKEYTFAKEPPVELILKNLKYIRENLEKKVYLILILGSETPTNKVSEGYEGVYLSHAILNKHVREFAKNYENIDLIELGKFVKSDDDYDECVNHFSRRVYMDFAKEIVERINSKFGSGCIEVKND